MPWLHGQQRPPAVPLIAHDPYFSVWSAADKLTDRDTTHWTGARQPITGLARIDGKTYRFMGADPREVPAMEQVSLSVTATHTVYQFRGGQVDLTLTFFTPAFPRDLDLLSRPVTYLTVTATGQGSHDVSILIDVDPVIAVDKPDEPVTWGRSRAGDLTVLSVGSRDQRVLNRPGDDLRIDWGYFRLAVPDQANAQLSESAEAIDRFVTNGELPAADDLDMPRMPREGAAHLAVDAAAGQASTQTPVTRHLLLAYTEDYAIEYLGRKLRPYWQRNGQTVQDMLAAAEKDFPALEDRGKHFDEELTADLEKTGGKAYAQLAILAYRQTLAAHGFAADFDGTPMLFPKENFSNGCISTVDVLYPSAPFFLFFNPALLQAQLKPVLEYAALPRWKWPFAPHDLGTYPLANGQVYGGGERTEEDQMPVEESGNLLIARRRHGDANWATGTSRGSTGRSFPNGPSTCATKASTRPTSFPPTTSPATWPTTPTCPSRPSKAWPPTPRWRAAWARTTSPTQYSRAAKEMADKWQQMGLDGDHYKLAFDKPGTWSQKYNLVWDQILGFNLFPASVRQTEIAFYLKHLNRFGLPLDNRKDYTKLDWQIWTATLADKPADWNALLDPIGHWINEGPTRVPLTDWYDTKTGKQEAFQARSVVGGVYIKALADKALAEKWRKASF